MSRVVPSPVATRLGGNFFFMMMMISMIFLVIATSSSSLFFFPSSSSSSPFVDATSVPQSITGNWSLLDLNILNENETVCGSVYTSNNRVWLGIESASNNTGAGFIVEIDLTTKTRLRSVYNNFTTTRPCTLITDGTNLYVGTNTDPAHLYFFRLSDMFLFYSYQGTTLNNHEAFISCGAIGREQDTRRVYFGSQGTGTNSAVLMLNANDGGNWVSTPLISAYNQKSMSVIGRTIYVLASYTGNDGNVLVQVDAFQTVQTQYNYYYGTGGNIFPNAGFTDGDFVYAAYQTPASDTNDFFRFTAKPEFSPMSVEPTPSSSGAGASCVASTSQVSFNGRNFFYGLGTGNVNNGACKDGIAVGTPIHQIPQDSSAEGGFEMPHEIVQSTFIDDMDESAYYVFDKRTFGRQYMFYENETCISVNMTNITALNMTNITAVNMTNSTDNSTYMENVTSYYTENQTSYYINTTCTNETLNESWIYANLSSYVISSPQKVINIPHYVSIRHLNGMHVQVQNMRQTRDAAKTRCNTALMNSDNEGGFLANLDSQDRQSLLRQASGDWTQVWLGAKANSNYATTAQFAYWGWSEGPSDLQSTNVAYFRNNDATQRFLSCQGRSYCTPFSNAFAVGYGSCLLGRRQTDTWIQEDCDMAMAPGLCQWENANVSTYNSVLSSDRLMTVFTNSRGSTAAPKMMTIDTRTNYRYEWGTTGYPNNRFNIMHSLFRDEVTDFISFTAATPSEFKILQSRFMYVAATNDRVYEIDLTAKTTTEVYNYGSFRDSGSALQLVEDMGVMIVYGSTKTDIFAIDKNTNARSLAWTKNTLCRSIVISKSLSRISSYCGNSVTVEYFFQDPISGRFTIYKTLPQQTNFNTPVRKAFAMGTGMLSPATVIVTQEAIPEIPLAYDSPNLNNSADACNTICKDLADLDTSNCTISLVTIASNVTAASINGLDINMVSSNRLAQVDCSFGTNTAFTNAQRYDSLHEFVIVRSGLEKNATGVRPLYQSGFDPTYTINRVEAWESTFDPENLIGVVMDVTISSCIFENRPSTWFQYKDYLYNNFNFRQSPDSFSDADKACSMHIVFYYNVSANSRDDSVVWQMSFGGTFKDNLPKLIARFSKETEAIIGSKIAIQRKSGVPMSNNNVNDNIVIDYRQPAFDINDHSAIDILQPAAHANGTASPSSFIVNTDRALYVLKKPEPADVPNVISEYIIRLDTKDFAEEIHVLRCDSPTSGKLFFKADSSFPKYGQIDSNYMPGINSVMFEPNIGSGAFFDSSTNTFAITSVPCPYTDGGMQTLSRIDLVVNFTGNPSVPLRIPFVILPHGAAVPSNYPPLPQTTATATPAPGASPAASNPPIVSLPEFPPTSGNTDPITNFPNAVTLDQAATALGAEPAGSTYTMTYMLKSPLLGTLQINTSAFDGQVTASLNADKDTATFTSTNPMVLANVLRGGATALYASPDVAALNLEPRAYLQIAVQSPGGTSAVAMPLTVLKVNRGPMVYNGGMSCKDIPMPQGRIWHNFSFGSQLFYHPDNFVMTLSMEVLDGLRDVPETMRVNLYQSPLYSSNGTGTYNSNVDLRIRYNATDGVMMNSVICNLKPYWVTLNVQKPVTSLMRYKAKTSFTYFIPLDIFQSSSTEIRYTAVKDPTGSTAMLMQNGDITFVAPNILQGSFPQTGDYSLVVEAADQFDVRTTMLNFRIGNVGPVVGQVLPIEPVHALRPFNISRPVPCTDPDHDPILVTVINAPPSWVHVTLAPGQKTTQAQFIYLSGTPPRTAVSMDYRFDVQCSDDFAAVTYNQTIPILGSRAPELVRRLPNFTVEVGTELKTQLNGWDLFSDPDGDQFSIYASVPSAVESWMSTKIITPSKIDTSTNAQNNERLQIVAAPPRDDWEDKHEDETVFKISIWAVDDLGEMSATETILVRIDYTPWMRAAPIAVPLIAVSGTFIFLAFLVCCYPCFLNYLYKRRSAIIDCPITKSNPTFYCPEETARFEIAVRRPGCVWPLWICSDYLYDQWTLKPMPFGVSPSWLEVEDDSITFVENPRKKVSQNTKEVVVRCFSGGGLIICQFTANYEDINGGKIGGGGTNAYKHDQEMNEKPFLQNNNNQQPEIVVPSNNNNINNQQQQQQALQELEVMRNNQQQQQQQQQPSPSASYQPPVQQQQQQQQAPPPPPAPSTLPPPKPVQQSSSKFNDGFSDDDEFL